MLNAIISGNVVNTIRASLILSWNIVKMSANSIKKPHSRSDTPHATSSDNLLISEVMRDIREPTEFAS